MADEGKLTGVSDESDEMKAVFADMTVTQNEMRAIQRDIAEHQKEGQAMAQQLIELDGVRKFLQAKVATYQEKHGDEPVKIDNKEKLTKLLE